MESYIKLGDCLELMKEIPDASVDLILCDLPYGTTACKWDVIIPFDKLWEQYNRIIKEHGAIALFGSQPFTSKLICSNIKGFKYEWIYQKRCASNFAQAKYAPMKEHENILIFGRNKVNYYPIMEERKGSGKARTKYKYTEKSRHHSGEFVGAMCGEFDEYSKELRYPSSIQEFNNRAKGDRGLHPTQKPIELLKYLIKTYTKEQETVLDNAMGSGSTCVACVETNRKYIGFEKDEKYFKIASERIKEAKQQGQQLSIFDFTEKKGEI